MGICYEEQPRNNKPYTGPPIEELNPHPRYLQHYRNLLTLRWIANNDSRQRRQAQKELVICQRKLDFWQRHHAFKMAVVLPGIELLKKQF